MQRYITALFCALPFMAHASLQCANDTQLDPRVLMQSFMEAELNAQRPHHLISWENLKPAYKGYEYIYPISNPKLTTDSLTVINGWKLNKIEMRGDEAVARVEMFTVADIWRPKGSEANTYGRRVTEIGEKFIEKYRMKKIDQCWYLIDPPKPVVAFNTFMQTMETDLSQKQSLSKDEVTDEIKRAKLQLEKEIPTFVRLKERYIGV